ncbi:unnamed protein product [Absidia cylindrospora]
MTVPIHPLAQLSSSSTSSSTLLSPPPPHCSSSMATTLSSSSPTSCHPSPTLVPSATSDVITTDNSTPPSLQHQPMMMMDINDAYRPSSTYQEPQQQQQQQQHHHHQQRAYSVTAMPSELQKTVLRHQQKQQEQQQQLMQNQPWWQYYYQRYHYHPPPGRKPTVFGPYLLLQTLGEGEFGKVKLGIHIESGHEVAIKLIKRDNIDSSTRMTKVEREISVLRTVRHPYIVKLYDVIETEKYIGIILQCASGGELFEYILAHRYLKEKDASRLFAQLISGVHYMHQKHIVHRDLKLENLLLDRHRSIIITDFGFANQFSSTRDDLMSTSCGSPCYAAPELVISEGLYVGSAVDIWSCGVILYAMLCGYLPFDDDPANPDGDNINLLYKYILNTPLAFPEYVSADARDLLRKMLVPDPAKRCSMEIIMAHPWLTPHRNLFGKNVHELEMEAMRSSDLPIHMVISNHHQHQQLLQQQQQQLLQQQQADKDQSSNNRRNTIATEYTLPTDEKEEEDDHVVPADNNEPMDIDEMPAQVHHDLAVADTTTLSKEEPPVNMSPADSPTGSNKVDNNNNNNETTTMQDIASIELPASATPPPPPPPTNDDAQVPSTDFEPEKMDATITPAATTDTDDKADSPPPKDVQEQVEQTSIMEQQPTIVIENSSTPSLTTPEKTSKQQKELEEEQEEAASVVPELPQPSPSPSPSKRQSTSTDRLLLFLSGGNSNNNNQGNSTPKVARHSSTNSNHTQRRPMSLLGDSNAGSILQAKFLSSMQRQNQRRSSPSSKDDDEHHGRRRQATSPSASLSASHIPTTTSSSKHHSISFTAAAMGTSATTSNTSSSIRLSPDNNTARTPQPGSSQPIRGTRRKALSLLVNSMTDYIGHDEPSQQQQQKRSSKKPMVFSRRQQQQQQQQLDDQHHHQSPTSPKLTTNQEISATSTPLLPSVSEHTNIALNKDAKHRSAGKKLMDWFKKKPLSTKDRPVNGAFNDRLTTNNNNNNKLLSKLPLGSYAVDFNDAKLRNHHGAVDQDALTARPPQEVLQQIKHTLTVTMGMEIKRDGGDYKLKCTRKKRTAATTTTTGLGGIPTPTSSSSHHHQRTTTTSSTTAGAPFRRMLMRKSSEQQQQQQQQQQDVSSSSSSSSSSNPTPPQTIGGTLTYGDPALDPGDEVRFSVELCKIKNLPGLYIVDIRRMRGNLWSYKFLYHALLEQLNLSGNGGYISNHPPATAAATAETASQQTNGNHQRASMISSGAGSSVMEDPADEQQQQSMDAPHAAVVASQDISV